MERLSLSQRRPPPHTVHLIYTYHHTRLDLKLTINEDA